MNKEEEFIVRGLELVLSEEEGNRAKAFKELESARDDLGRAERELVDRQGYVDASVLQVTSLEAEIRHLEDGRLEHDHRIEQLHRTINARGDDSD